MAFDARALPVARLPPDRLALQPSPRQPDRAHPDGGSVVPTACVVMIDGWLTHRVALTVAKLPGPRGKG